MAQPASKAKQISAFPSDFATKAEKLDPKYGLEYFKAAWNIYSLSSPINNPQLLQYLLNRQFAEGTYSTDFARQRLGLEGDLSYLNLDLTSINRIATIVDNMVGKLTDKQWRLQCNPTDVASKTKYDEYRSKIEANMFLAQHSAPVEQLTGMPLVPKGDYTPKDDEEKNLHLQMDYKMDASTAMEIALEWVFDNNDFSKDDIEWIFRDLIDCKKTAIYRYYDDNYDIKVKRWDHLKVITPYSTKPDFSDIPYQGLLHTFTIGDIAKMNPDFTDEDLYNIAMCYAGNSYGNPLWNPDWFLTYSQYFNANGAIALRQFHNFNIVVTKFYFKTPMVTTVVSKTSKTGRTNVEYKKEDYKNENGLEVVRKKKLYRMEGWWIPTTDYIWDYKMSRNVERDGAYNPEVDLPCKVIVPNMMAMKNKSLVERMIPFEKQLLLAWAKLQQFLIKAMPPGIAINNSALLDIVAGMGEGKTPPIEWMKMFEQTGSFIYNGTGIDGQQINKPFDVMPGGISPAFEQFMRVADYCINKMNEVVGYNTAVDASSPSADAAVGTNKMAAQATYNCMRPLYNAGILLIESQAKRVALMIQDCIRFDENGRQKWVDAIGEENVSVLEMGSETPFNASAIEIEIMPDEEEQAYVNNLINLGIQNQTLETGQVLRVRQQLKTNVKQAGQLLSYFESKNKKDAQDRALQMQQQNGQTQIQSAQAASQSQAQLDAILTENKIKLINAQLNADMQKMQAESQLALQLQDRKNEGANTVAEINTGAKVSVQEAANKGKIIAQHVANEGNIEKEHVIHSSEIIKKHLEHESEIQKGLLDHDSKLEQISLTAHLTPKKETKK